MTSHLQYKLFVTGQIPQSGRGPLPDGSTRMWSPITSTLILGTHDAVLVDPPLTNTQAAEVGDWIETSRAPTPTDLRHPRAWGPLVRSDSPAGTVSRRRRACHRGHHEHMATQNSADFRADFWDRVFPGQLPTGDVDVDLVGESGFELEGVALLPVEVGHTDTDATTMLHVPDIGLVVAGDVVYNGVHQYLTESGGVAGIDEWLAALDVAEALRPVAVIAGHKNPGAFDNPSQIHSTRRYLTDARELLESSTRRGRVLRQRMLARHPDRLNPGRPLGCRDHAVPAGLTIPAKTALACANRRAVMAVAEGFEPSDGGYPSHAFEACSLGRSDTPPCGTLPGTRTAPNRRRA